MKERPRPDYPGVRNDVERNECHVMPRVTEKKQWITVIFYVFLNDILQLKREIESITSIESSGDYPLVN